MNKELLDYIKTLSEDDKKNLSQKALKVCEEAGELAKVVLPYDNAFATNHRFVVKESILEECVDVILTALSVAYDQKFSHDDIEEMMHKKVQKWAGLQNNEKELKYPLPYEIHITVNIEKWNAMNGYLYGNDPLLAFKMVCERAGVKLILLDLHTQKGAVIKDMMTSSKHFGTNASAVKESERIIDYIKSYSIEIERVKIETVPWHPAAPKYEGQSMPSSCYFECHIPITLAPNCEERLDTMIYLVKRSQDITLHKSKNIFKKHNDGKVTIMLTYRNVDTWQSRFEHEVATLITSLSADVEFYEIGKTHIEFSVYDTKISHDALWLKDTSKL